MFAVTVPLVHVKESESTRPVEDTVVRFVQAVAKAILEPSNKVPRNVINFFI